jgi:hypothetical protein
MHHLARGLTYVSTQNGYILFPGVTRLGHQPVPGFRVKGLGMNFCYYYYVEKAVFRK